MLHVIRQGITTELVGQDGSSVTPVTDEVVTELADNKEGLDRIEKATKELK